MASATSTTARFSKNGFTLPEVLISMSIGCVLIALVLSLSVIQGRLCLSLGDFELANRQSRIAMKQFESDIRQARTILPTENKQSGFDPMIIKLETIIGFDAEGDPIKEIVTYSYNTTKKSLERQYANRPKKTLIENLSACQFTYFGINDTPLPSGVNATPAPTELRKVVLSGTVTKTRGAKENRDHLITASVVLRKPLN